MTRAMEALDTFDFDHVSSGAENFRAHRGQYSREILDFGLARRVFDKRASARSDRRHQDIFGGANRRRIQPDSRADEFFGVRLDVAVTKLDLAAERSDSRDMQVYRTRAYRASAGSRDTRAAGPREQRSQHHERRAHGLDQLVRSF